MAEFDNTNRGSLFMNKYKKGNDKQPLMKGKIDVNGEEFEISAWGKTFKNKEGEEEKMFSLAVSPPYKKDEPKSQATATPAEAEDDLPF